MAFVFPLYLFKYDGHCGCVEGCIKKYRRDIKSDRLNRERISRCCFHGTFLKVGILGQYIE